MSSLSPQISWKVRAKTLASPVVGRQLDLPGKLPKVSDNIVLKKQERKGMRKIWTKNM